MKRAQRTAAAQARWEDRADDADFRADKGPRARKRRARHIIRERAFAAAFETLKVIGAVAGGHEPVELGSPDYPAIGLAVQTSDDHAAVWYPGREIKTVVIEDNPHTRDALVWRSYIRKAAARLSV